MQHRLWLFFWAATAHCQFVLGFSSTNTLGVSPLDCCKRILHSACLCASDCNEPYEYPCTWMALLILMRFAQTHLCSLSGSLWVASLLFIVLTTSQKLVSPTNVLEVHSTVLSKSATKRLNSTSTTCRPLKNTIVSTQPLSCCPQLGL